MGRMVEWQLNLTLQETKAAPGHGRITYIFRSQETDGHG